MSTRTLRALQSARTALNDWMATYADTECAEEDVEEAHSRIRANGGTLLYIASTQRLIDEAISSIPSAEQPK